MQIKVWHLFLILSLILSCLLPSLFSRWQRENNDTTVELCLDGDYFYRLCRELGFNWEEFLLRVRELGIYSFAFSEDKYVDWEESGLTTVISKKEGNRLAQLNLSPRIKLAKYDTWFFSTAGFAHEIIPILCEQLNIPNTLQSRRKEIVFTFPAEYVPNESLRLGLHRNSIKSVLNFGYHLILLLDQYPSPYIFTSKVQPFISGYWFLEEKKTEFYTRPLPRKEQKLSLISNLSPGQTKLILPEFSVLSESKRIIYNEKQNNFTLHFTRGHRLGEQEYLSYVDSPRPVQEIILRLLRAVKERNVRVLYILPLPKMWTFTESEFYNGKEFIPAEISLQLNFLARLKSELLRHKYNLDKAQPVPYQSTPWFRLVLGLGNVVAVVFPLAAIWLIPFRLDINSRYFGSEKVKPLLFFCFICLTNLIAGLTIASLLYRSAYYLKIYEFTSVKFCIFTPLLFTGLWFYRRELKPGLTQPIKVWFLLLFVLLAGAILILFLRSGNQSFGLYSKIEHHLRLFLETTLAYRPRWKEFLIGHPFMILGLYLYGKYKGQPSKVPFYLDYRHWLVFGMVGQVSLINTFCHIHTPLSVSLLRTFHGIWLGMGLGLILIFMVTIKLLNLKNFILRFSAD